MSYVCPKDYGACCDDLCHGAGCLRMGGYPMLLVCNICHGVIDEENPDWGSTCTCEDVDDYGDEP